MQRKRIAIYGGTFDPVHSAHLAIARRVSELFAIDEFLFIPARLAPHKMDREVSSALHRYAMLALATQEEPRLSISTFELEGRERQFTVDTLLHFCSQPGEPADLFFVMGTDSWSEITTWHQWQRLLSLCNLIVDTRPGYEFSAQTVEFAGAEIVDARGLKKEKVSTLVEAGRQKIFLTDAVMLDVSATKIRQAVRENSREDLGKLVPPAVADYIGKYKLYRNTNEA